ncbi:MAG TPA: DUF2066 domain-containing protein [Stellaceae bacterium]|jgi:hypothetical protein|nr:DUF2066 domain-containing protein [Stellaceae bacterium]
MTRHRFFCIVCTAVLLAAASAGAQQPSPPTNGNYLGSWLMPSEPQALCPPEIPALYQAYEIVTGTDMRQRPWGFAQTLREVLVKVSGDPRLKTDPRTPELTAHAADFVACFHYADQMADVPLHDEQGTYDRPYKLTVTFDPGKIDALLAKLGDHPWRDERPVVVPVLVVHGRKPPAYLLSAEAPEGAEQRAAFATAAGQFGLKFRFPADAEMAGWSVSLDHFPPSPPQPATGEAIVLGTLDWNESLPGWISQWRMRWDNVDHEWGVSGVNYDAAFRDILGGVELIASGNGSPDPDHGEH